MEKLFKQHLHHLSQYTADFIKSKTGKGPKDIKCHLVDNKIFIEMTKLLTPIELEIATTPEGITNVKLARERFYEKYAQNYQSIVGQILGCQILYGCTTWDITNDEAYIILTVNLTNDLSEINSNLSEIS